MKRTFQSFVFGCRVNEAERMKIDKELVEAGFSVDLASPSFLIINTCAITGKAEREAKQLVYQLRRKHPEAKIVITGCSSTLWNKYSTKDEAIADLVVPNDKKSSLVALLTSTENLSLPYQHISKTALTAPLRDKFRYSNRLLVKIQDGCHRFCAYCIVPYLRGQPQSVRIHDIVSYIQSFTPAPSEVVLSAINTEAFGTDTGETLVSLLQEVLAKTNVQRIAFGSIHPWSLTEEFLNYYSTHLAHEKRFVHFFHVPIQSGSNAVLKHMRREYDIQDVIDKLKRIKKTRPDALIATDVIVGYLGESNTLFEETYAALRDSVIDRFHVFRFSNRPHTAAFYLKKQLTEPSTLEKKERSARLIALSQKKYEAFVASQIGRAHVFALVIAEQTGGMKILLDNHVEGLLPSKDCLPGQIVHVTIIAAKDSIVICTVS